MEKWMNVWKMGGWLCKAVAAGLIISFLSIWTTGYIVNSYVETLLKQYHIPLETQPFALNGLWGDLWGADSPASTGTAETPDSVGEGADAQSSSSGSEANKISALGEDDSGGSDGTGASDTGHAAENGGEGAGNQGGLGPDSTNGADSGSSDSTGDVNGTIGSGSNSLNGAVGTTGSGGTGTAEDSDPATKKSPAGGDENNDGSSPLAIDAYGDADAGALTDIGGGSGPKGNSAPAGGSSSTGEEADGSSADEALKDGTAMSAEQLNAAKNEMSEADKEQLFGTVMTKLPQTAWQQISKLMEDGLTAQEMTEVKQLLAQYLSRSEYDDMMRILSKY